MKPHTWNYFVFFAILLNLYACRQQRSTMVESTSASISRNLPYEVREIRKTDGDCQSPESPCVIMSVMYPIVNSGTEAAREKMNNDVEKLVASKMQRYTSEQMVASSNLDSIGEAFIARFNQLLVDFPEYQQRWSYNLEGSIAFDTTDIITIEFNLYTFTGGAHPNAEVIYNSYNTETGERLQLTDIVSDVERLTALAEEKFRQKKELTPDADLNEAGFNFENNLFALNENFGVLEDGIIFYYNDYEIAPYAMGPTEILITYEELGDMLKI